LRCALTHSVELKTVGLSVGSYRAGRRDERGA
jgi:hypothetical protein